MTGYATMSYHLETERLILRPWAESDAADFSELLSERGEENFTVERGRKGIAGSTVATWNAPSLRVLEKLDFVRDHLSAEENGEVVWLTRELP
ncbi:hypothetical protein OHA46_01170 [Streptomyces sp. NBC_00708]